MLLETEFSTHVEDVRTRSFKHILHTKISHSKIFPNHSLIPPKPKRRIYIPRYISSIALSPSLTLPLPGPGAGVERLLCASTTVLCGLDP